MGTGEELREKNLGDRARETPSSEAALVGRLPANLPGEDAGATGEAPEYPLSSFDANWQPESSRAYHAH